jgi:outer membrane receptor protein involved in Fe transport
MTPWGAQKSVPRFAIEYQPEGGSFYYASMAKGTRQGGGNGAGPCGSFVPPARYGSDAVWNYELGARLRFMEEHLRVSGTLFNLRWNGVQEALLDACGDTYFANAGSALSQGFDLDAEYAARGWNLQLALGYLDAHYTRTLFDASGHVVVRAGDVLGGYPAVAAPWSGRLAVRHRWPQGFYAGGQLVFQSRNDGPFTGQDPLAAEPLPANVKADPGTARLGVQGGWQWGEWELRLAVDNVTGRQPALQGGADAAGYTPLYGYTWAPRTWRLSLGWQR